MAAVVKLDEKTVKVKHCGVLVSGPVIMFSLCFQKAYADLHKNRHELIKGGLGYVAVL